MPISAGIDPDALVARAREAVPTLAKYASLTEEHRRVAVESAEAARAAGAFALTTPQAYGGLGANSRTSVEVLSELGRGCPSTAWVAGTSGEVKVMADPMLSEDLRAEIFIDPDVRLCGRGAPAGQGEQVPGGLRITGRWSYASGCEDSSWAVVTVMVAEGGRFVRPAPVLLPVADLGIDRTWNVAGLRGTGSHTLTAENLLVPRQHVLALPVTKEGLPDFSANPALPLRTALLNIAPMLGAAQGALDVLTAVLHERRPPNSAYLNLAASAEARVLFSEASLLVDAARRRVLYVADTVDRLEPGAPLSAMVSTTLRMELVQAVRESRAAVENLLDLHGSSGFATDNPLQRFWRDLAVGTRHAQFTPYLAVEAHGKALAGTSNSQ